MSANVEINPQQLFGSWKEGWSLDLHTIRSEFLGYDEFGNAIFDNIRSDIGDMLYLLKYKENKGLVEPIARAAAGFLRNSSIADKVNLIVPVPPSRYRSFQPVVVLGEKIAELLGLKFIEDLVIKEKDIEEIKNIPDKSRRMEKLKDAFTIEANVKDKNILLFDDLYQTGATLTAITKVLVERARASNVYVLAITKTRTEVQGTGLKG